MDTGHFGRRILSPALRAKTHKRPSFVFGWACFLAAIRERIFIDIDPETGEADGGLLLYTAQPGGDGTLGGLIALVPEFERVLERALHNLDTCSNDPLCGEEYFGLRKYNGAACYACLLVSETSCEHRNMSLDRNLLLEHRP